MGVGNAVQAVRKGGMIGEIRSRAEHMEARLEKLDSRLNELKMRLIGVDEPGSPSPTSEERASIVRPEVCEVDRLLVRTGHVIDSIEGHITALEAL